MATPAVAALLTLGKIPSFGTALLGLFTAFAGYTAVYALNDVVDYRADKEKFDRCGLACAAGDMDAVFVRHPLAQGLLSLREGILWTVSWGTAALFGAYLLNPVCALVFILGCMAEAIYCLMLRVSWKRTLLSGTVKTAGGVAAIFAVRPDPPPFFVLILFLWLFAWEIGGQNVPNDWSDVDEDRDLEAETIPVKFGAERAARIISATLGVSVFLSLVLGYVSPAPRFYPAYPVGALLAGIFLLLLPARRLYLERGTQRAAALFNLAGYYPVAMLATALVGIWG